MLFLLPLYRIIFLNVCLMNIVENGKALPRDKKEIKADNIQNSNDSDEPTVTRTTRRYKTVD